MCCSRAAEGHGFGQDERRVGTDWNLLAATRDGGAGLVSFECRVVSRFVSSSLMDATGWRPVLSYREKCCTFCAAVSLRPFFVVSWNQEYYCTLKILFLPSSRTFCPAICRTVQAVHACSSDSATVLSVLLSFLLTDGHVPCPHPQYLPPLVPIFRRVLETVPGRARLCGRGDVLGGMLRAVCGGS